MSADIAAVIPIHQKDLPRLALCLKGLRDHVVDIGDIYVVGAAELAGDVRATASAAGAAGVRFVAERDHFQVTRGWVLQQEIKLYASRFLDTDVYAVIDSDTYFLNRTALRDAEGRLTFCGDVARGRYGDHRKVCNCCRYVPTIHHIFGLSHQLHARCFVAHHAVFDSHLVGQMLAPIASEGLESAFKRAYRSGASFSEFDTYGAFVQTHAPGRYAYRDDLWADIPWPTEMTDQQRARYLDRYAQAGYAYVSAHAYLHGYDSIEGCNAFVDWLVHKIDKPVYRAGRWGLQQWRRRQRSAAAELEREIERAIECRVRVFACYRFIAPDGVSVLRSEVLEGDAALSVLRRETPWLRAFVTEWAALARRAELDTIAEALRSCDQLLQAQPADFAERLAVNARHIVEAWRAMGQQPGGTRMGVPLTSFSTPAIAALLRLLQVRRSDPMQLFDYIDELLSPAIADDLRR